MADEAPAGNPYELLLFVGGIAFIFIALWWVQGGPNKQAANSDATPSTQTDTGTNTNVDTSVTTQPQY